MRLLGQTQLYRFAYLMSLPNNREVTEELIQETNLVLWREFENSEPGTNFTCCLSQNTRVATRRPSSCFRWFASGKPARTDSQAVEVAAVCP